MTAEAARQARPDWAVARPTAADAGATATTPDHRLRSLANEAELLTRLRGSGDEWDWLVVPRIRRLLDLSVKLLAELADDIGADEAQGRRVLAVRDDVAAHLRAADHVLAAQARPEAHTNLLVQAIERLLEEYGEVDVEG